MKEIDNVKKLNLNTVKHGDVFGIGKQTTNPNLWWVIIWYQNDMIKVNNLTYDDLMMMINNNEDKGNWGGLNNE